MTRREIAIFLAVGTLTVLVDFLTYRSVVWIELASVEVAKATGFLAGTVFAYFANRLWTFGHKAHAAGSLWRFSILYTATLGVNVFVNSLALALLAGAATAVQMAFILATGVSACLNFVGMKLFVFRSASAQEIP